MTVSLRNFAGVISGHVLSVFKRLLPAELYLALLVDFSRYKEQGYMTTKLREKEVELRTGDWFLMTLCKLDSATPGIFS